MTWFYYLVTAFFGLIIGSFINVAICRLPTGETLGKRSHCTSCGEMIHWYDNVPLLSFVVLRGKCRRCGAPISWQYPLVELSTSLLFVLMYWWSISIVPGMLHIPGGQLFVPELTIGLLLVTILMIAGGVDITHGLVPNKALYPGMVMLLLLVTGLALYRGQPGRIGLAVAGAAIAGGFLLVAGLLYGAFFMRAGEPVEGEPGAVDETGTADVVAKVDGPIRDMVEDEDDVGFATGIGMGDVKLAAFFGLALGYFHWYLVAVALFLGFLAGLLASIFLMIAMGKGRKDRIAFAPYLSIGAVIALLWGQYLADLYIKLFR